MPVKAPKGKCCSGRSAKLKKANYDKAIKAAKKPPGEWGVKPAKPKKATAKKATAKKAKGCRVCAKK